jgi:hypothetical protein
MTRGLIILERYRARIKKHEITHDFAENLEVLSDRTKTIKTRNFVQPSVITAYKTMESGVGYTDNGKIRKKARWLRNVSNSEMHNIVLSSHGLEQNTDDNKV